MCDKDKFCLLADQRVQDAILAYYNRDPRTRLSPDNAKMQEIYQFFVRREDVVLEQRRKLTHAFLTPGGLERTQAFLQKA